MNNKLVYWYLFGILTSYLYMGIRTGKGITPFVLSLLYGLLGPLAIPVMIVIDILNWRRNGRNKK